MKRMNEQTYQYQELSYSYERKITTSIKRVIHTKQYFKYKLKLNRKSTLTPV